MARRLEAASTFSIPQVAQHGRVMHSLAGPQGPAGKGGLLCSCHSCLSPYLTSKVKYPQLVAGHGSLLHVLMWAPAQMRVRAHTTSSRLSLKLVSRLTASSVRSSRSPLLYLCSQRSCRLSWKGVLSFFGFNCTASTINVPF